MRVQTIVYVTDMEGSVDWYRRVLGVAPTHHGTSWSSFRIGSTNLALHAIDEPMEPGRVELSLIVLEQLEAVVSRLESVDIEIARGIADETFGRSIRLRDPEGMSFQINEHDPELYED